MKEPALNAALSAVDAFARDNDYASAMELCESTLMQAPAEFRHRILGWKANVEWKLGDKYVALALVEQAKESNPNWAGHLHKMARWQLELGEFDAAKETAKELIDLERRRGSSAFLDAGRFIGAYASLKKGDYQCAYDWASEIEDTEPVWLGGKLISRGEILGEARSRNAV